MLLLLLRDKSILNYKIFVCTIEPKLITSSKESPSSLLSTSSLLLTSSLLSSSSLLLLLLSLSFLSLIHFVSFFWLNRKCFFWPFFEPFRSKSYFRKKLSKIAKFYHLQNHDDADWCWIINICTDTLLKMLSLITDDFYKIPKN